MNLYTILLAFVDTVRNQYNERHYKEALRRFHDARAIAMQGSLPAVYLLRDGSYALTPTERYQVGYDVRERPAPNQLQGHTQKQNGSRDRNRRATYRNFKWENLYDCCQLFRDFSDGNTIYDMEQVIMLARSICGAEKGKDEFLRMISNQQQYPELHWHEILTAIIKGNLPLAPCSQCDYCAHCHHADNMLATARPQKYEIRVLGKEDYVSIEEAIADLQNAFHRAAEAADLSLYIIKGQTGLGKTEAYLDYMAHSDKPLLIAVPTHELKQEIVRRAKSRGITEICCTPDLEDYPLSSEIMETVRHLYAIGAGHQVLRYLSGQLRRLKQGDSDYAQIADYLKRHNSASRSKGHIVTTHARLVHMARETTESHLVIIDEDILRTLLNTDSVDMKEIRELRSKNMFHSAFAQRIRELCNLRGYHQLEPLDIPADEQQVMQLNCVDSNIYGLLRSAFVYVTAEKIFFLTEEMLPPGKLIILSATIDPELYRLLYPDRRIDAFECRQAKYKGRIIQYTDSSYSRYAFQHYPDLLVKVKLFAANDTVITFQESEKEFRTKYHFGNVEGLNHLNGKNLSVVGLPNAHEIMYCLYGMRAGSSLKKRHMYAQRIRHENYSFELNTYRDEILRRIQLWTISSQLEQAIGRARLLRENCTVQVFSRFPVAQSSILTEA